MQTKVLPKFIMYCIVLLAGLFPAVVLGQYDVAPILLDRTLDPGAKETVDITLYNSSDRMVRIYPTVNAVSVDDTGTIVEFQSRNESDDQVTVTSWLAISRGRIELDPGETKKIPLTLDVHTQAKAGVYHAFIGFAQGSNRPAAEQIVAQGNAPGTLVRVEIEENRTAYLQLDGFSTDRFLTSASAAQASFTINNPSDTPLLPSGEMIIYNARGVELGSVPLMIDQEIKPGTTEAITLPMPPLEDEIGRHKAILSVRYGDGQTALLQDTVFFYHLPLLQLLLLFFSVIAIALLIAYLVHRRYSVDDDDVVAMYHRPKVVREAQEHDLDLTAYDERS